MQPHDERAEQSVLGAMILQPECIAEVSGTLEAEMMYDERHEAICRMIYEMAAQGKQIDLMTLCDTLNRSGQLDEVGGPAYLAELTQRVGSGAHILAHAGIVIRMYVNREVYASLSRMQRMMLEGVDSETVLSCMSTLGERIGSIAASGSTLTPLAHAAEEALREAERRAANFQKGIVPGVDTGIGDLNRIVGGWLAGQLVVIASRPAMGKTALLLHLAKAAARAGIPVALFSLEMSTLSLANRMLLSECTVSPERFRRGELDSADWHELERASARIKALPIYIDDKPAVNMRYIRAVAGQLKSRKKCGLIVVDYLQLARPEGRQSGANREQQVAEMSRSAKMIAKELNVPFLLAAQLSRGVEQRQEKKPQLSDLRESGAIEQDADVVGFIYRPEYYGTELIELSGGVQVTSKGYGEIIIAKQRDGATGTARFAYNESLTRITDWNRERQIGMSQNTTEEPF